MPSISPSLRKDGVNHKWLVLLNKFRVRLLEVRGIEIDIEGREALRGLSFDETEEYYAYVEHGLLDQQTANGSTRYLDLSDKHEKARIIILIA